MAAELAERAEHAEKHFLGEVERLLGIAQQMQGELVDHALVIGDQPRAGGFIAGRALLDKVPVSRPVGMPLSGGGSRGRFRPAERAKGLHGGLAHHPTTPLCLFRHRRADFVPGRVLQGGTAWQLK